MDVIRLSVPFNQKEEVKKRGAKWDYKERFWYILADQDTSPFLQWLQSMPQDKIVDTYDEYFVAKSHRYCHKCKYKSEVIAIIVSKNINFKNKNDILRKKRKTGLSYIRYLSQPSISHINKLTDSYYYDHVHNGKDSYWMNHCQQCKAKFGDFETIGEYASPFRPISAAEAAKLQLYPICESLEVTACSNIYFPFFKRIKLNSYF